MFILRGDGNPNIGLGHLVRLSAISQYLCENQNLTFITRDPQYLNKLVDPRVKIKRIPQNITINEEPEWINNNFSLLKLTIVLDGYNFSSEYQKKIKSFGVRVVYVDDLASFHMHADLVINHSLIYSKNDFSHAPYTKLALGTKYALLRKGFIEQSKLKRKIERLEIGFICFGGSNFSEVLISVVKALVTIQSLKKLIVVSNSQKVIKSFYDGTSKIKVFTDLSEPEMIDLMKSSDFAVIPSSTIFLEACCINMPIISGYFVENQKMSYEGFVKNKLCVGIGNFNEYSESEFSKLLKLLIKSFNEVKVEEMLAQQKYFFCGDQIENIKNLLT